MRQSDVTNVSSVSREDLPLSRSEYTWNKDMDEAFLDLQKELSAFSQNSDLEDLQSHSMIPMHHP
jgi:HAE1 family hydrophobic/amphiphilic exporter-1